MDELLKSHFRRPGEGGGPPYGQLYGLRGLSYGNLLQRMSEAGQVGDVDVLFENGDLVQGSLPKE